MTNELIAEQSPEPTLNESTLPSSLNELSETLTFEERIIEGLRSIYDPEIPVNIYDLGLIYTIEINEQSEVSIQMTLTTPGCPVAGTFPQTVQDRLLSVKGVTSVTIDLVWEPTWTQDRMSEAAKLQLNLL